MRPRPPAATSSAAATAAAAVLVLLVGGCATESDPAGSGEASGTPATATSPPDTASPDTASPDTEDPASRLEATDVPFTEPEAPAPDSSDVPATLYEVLADSLDPRGEHLAAYDGSNDPATGVGAGEVDGGWSLNAEWRPRGLVGLLVAEQWPEGWVCVDAYPGCQAVELPDGRTAQALQLGRNQVSVGLEQPGGAKVVLSSVKINELSVADLVAAAADERLDLP